MNSIFFALQLVFVILVVVWAVKNEQAGDNDQQQGLFALRPGLPDQSTQQGRKFSRHRRHRREHQ